MFKHKTKDGKEIPLNEITDSHLINIARHILKMSENGITLRSGGGLLDGDPWYDERTVYKTEALNHLNYMQYVNELKRRGLR